MTCKKIDSFTPAGRLAHSSVIVGNKLYFSEELGMMVFAQMRCSILIIEFDKLKAGLLFKSCWATVSYTGCRSNSTKRRIIVDSVIDNTEKMQCRYLGDIHPLVRVVPELFMLIMEKEQFELTALLASSNIVNFHHLQLILRIIGL
ncbi:6504_t:CDS:2 [Funneliformis geosporum]|nr:6504_t:CDS:2 [Funneliformis geosporum]